MDCNFYHFSCKEFINGRAMDKFEISRRNERKPQPQAAWPVAMFIKDNHLKASPDGHFIKAGFNINVNGRFIKADGRFIMPM